MKTIKIPKNQTLVASEPEVEGIWTMDTNIIKSMRDNRDGHKGTPDFYLITIDNDEEIEITSAAFIDIPYKNLKIKFL